MASTEPPLIGVVLAAGKGTRMKSDRPKVLHEVAGRPMLHWVLDALDAAGCERRLVIVGHGAEEVRASCAGRQVEFSGVEYVEQREQLGTGHALAQVERALADQGQAMMLVVSGDVPLVSPETLERLGAGTRDAWGSIAVSRLERPGSLGRVVERDGALERIVEAADATEQELAIDLVNAGLYALPAPAIFDRIRRVGTDNAKGEVYLTDALGAAAADGERLTLVELDDPMEAQGVNDRRELALVGRRMNELHLDALAAAGVTILDPARTVVDRTVEIGADTVVHPDVNLGDGTVVGEGCVLNQGVWMRGSRIEDGVTVEPYCVLDGAHVRVGARVGPFARLRLGADVGEGAKDRQLRRDQELAARSRRQSRSPGVPGRRRGRRGCQHRRRHDHLQLRRGIQTSHRDRSRSLHRKRYDAGRAGSGG